MNYDEAIFVDGVEDIIDAEGYETVQNVGAMAAGLSVVAIIGAIVALIVSVLVIVWEIKTIKKIVKYDGEGDGILEILLTIFFAPAGLFLTERKLTSGCEKHGVEHSDKSILYLILSLFGLGLIAFILLWLDSKKIEPKQMQN